MDVLRSFLDDEQREIALEAVDSNLLVLAGPGSGKTRLLTHVAAYHLRREPLTKWRVLCLTFSVEATREMRNRLRSPDFRVPARRLEVKNFHQFGMDLLRAYGHHIGWPREVTVASNAEMIDIVADVIEELGIRGLSARDAAYGIEGVKRRRTDDENTHSESLRRLTDAYLARTADLRVRDFDDLILHSLELLRERPFVRDVVRRMYRYIVIDELQDTSAQQLELVEEIAGPETRVFAVADDDQMIYEWRDASRRTLDRFITRFEAREAPLLGNYRCPRRIVAAANRIILVNRDAHDQRPMPYSRVDDRDGQILVSALPRFADEPEHVGMILENELDAKVLPENIAILATVRFEFENIQAALERRSIPATVVGSEAFLSRPLSRLVQAAIAARLAPQERMIERLSRLAAMEEALNDEEHREWLDRVLATDNADAILDLCRTRLGLDSSDPDYEYAQRILLVARSDPTVASESLLTRLRMEWPRLDGQLKKNEKSVKIMTTFAAKGLEFDTVVLPYFDSYHAPFKRRGARFTERWWSEERRKLYVAITRAKRRVVMTYAGQPSEFIALLRGPELESYSLTQLK